MFFFLFSNFFWMGLEISYSVLSQFVRAPCKFKFWQCLAAGRWGHRIQFWEFSSKGNRQEINLKWLSTAYLPRLNEVIWRYNLLVNQIRLQKWSENTKREENCHSKNWLQNQLLNFHLLLMLGVCVIWTFVIPYFIFWGKKHSSCRG